MAPFPEQLISLRDGEEFLRTKSLEIIEVDEDLSRHVALVEQTMHVLNLHSTNPPDAEDEDTKVIRLLGMRLFNGCASALKLTLSGYYQSATMIMRDLLETDFLLGYFEHHPKEIEVWRTATPEVHKKHFAPVKVRMALDEKAGFTERKRAAAYNLLCELASHPTHRGLQMLAPKGREHHCGPFVDPTALKALIEELAKLAVLAGLNYGGFFKMETKDQLAARAAFMEACGEWFERYYGHRFDRKEIDEVKALLAQME